MAGTITLFKKGGEAVENVNELVSMTRNLTDENGVLRDSLEKYGAVIVGMQDMLEVFSQKIDNIEDHIVEDREKTFVGKRPEFLDTSFSEVQDLTHNEKRSFIYRAAGNQRSGYNRIYSKIEEMTGVRIRNFGKMKITRYDGLGVVKPQESYINTVFLKGVENEAAAIALDMIRNK